MYRMPTVLSFVQSTGRLLILFVVFYFYLNLINIKQAGRQQSICLFLIARLTFNGELSQKAVSFGASKVQSAISAKREPNYRRYVMEAIL